MDYFTADSHFLHSGAMSERNSNRPFDSLNEMHEVLINNINKKVKADDTLYILGDFSFKGSLRNIVKIRKLIRCKHLILVTGNHDGKYLKRLQFRELFDRIETRIFYKSNKMEIVLSHYAMLTWPKSNRGSYHLFGHSHGNLIHPSPRAFDVGVDCWDFKPLSILEIKEIFEKIIKDSKNKNKISRIKFDEAVELFKLINDAELKDLDLSEFDINPTAEDLWAWNYTGLNNKEFIESEGFHEFCELSDVKKEEDE